MTACRKTQKQNKSINSHDKQKTETNQIKSKC